LANPQAAAATMETRAVTIAYLDDRCNNNIIKQVEAHQSQLSQARGLPIISVYYDGRENTNRE